MKRTDSVVTLLADVPAKVKDQMLAYAVVALAGISVGKIPPPPPGGAIQTAFGLLSSIAPLLNLDRDEHDQIADALQKGAAKILDVEAEGEDIADLAKEVIARARAH